MPVPRKGAVRPVFTKTDAVSPRPSVIVELLFVVLIGCGVSGCQYFAAPVMAEQQEFVSDIRPVPFPASAYTYDISTEDLYSLSIAGDTNRCGAVKAIQYPVSALHDCLFLPINLPVWLIGCTCRSSGIEVADPKTGLVTEIPSLGWMTVSEKNVKLDAGGLRVRFIVDGRFIRTRYPVVFQIRSGEMRVGDLRFDVRNSRQSSFYIESCGIRWGRLFSHFESADSTRDRLLLEIHHQGDGVLLHPSPDFSGSVSFNGAKIDINNGNLAFR